MTSAAWLLIFAALLSAPDSAVAYPRARASHPVVCALRTSHGGACKIRPRSIGVGAKGGVSSITWVTWGGPVATGHGTLFVAGFFYDPGAGIGPTEAKVQFRNRRTCGNRREYSTITISYGRGRYYQRNDEWLTTC